MLASIPIHLSLIFACVGAVEIFIRFKFSSILAFFPAILNQVRRVLSSKQISDHWKEKVIPHYAFLLFRTSLKALILILGVMLIFSIPALLLEDFLSLTLSFLGVTESMIIVVIYIKIRKGLFE